MRSLEITEELANAAQARLVLGAQENGRLMSALAEAIVAQSQPAPKPAQGLPDINETVLSISPLGLVSRIRVTSVVEQTLFWGSDGHAYYVEGYGQTWRRLQAAKTQPKSDEQRARELCESEGGNWGVLDQGEMDDYLKRVREPAQRPEPAVEVAVTTEVLVGVVQRALSKQGWGGLTENLRAMDVRAIAEGVSEHLATAEARHRAEVAELEAKLDKAATDELERSEMYHKLHQRAVDNARDRAVQAEAEARDLRRQLGEAQTTAKNWENVYDKVGKERDSAQGALKEAISELTEVARILEAGETPAVDVAKMRMQERSKAAVDLAKTLARGLNEPPRRPS